MRSEIFGRLLKGAINSIATYESKTAPSIEDELGSDIGLTGASIQRYKAGHIPPDPRTCQILAEAAVKRGYLNREWLQTFLHAARYPAPEKLLNQLCPISQTSSRPGRIYHNLPAPPYNQFVMRTQAVAEVFDGLRQRSAVVLIVSLGGMGKTSLAREVATLCLSGDNASLFDAAVWASDKDRPGTMTLSIVLDKIAHTLDYPGFTQYGHEEKLREVEQLLRRQRVLLIVDNFETVTDASLLAWILHLPEPSKVIVTSREYSRLFRNNTFVVDLNGMSEIEAQNLIDQRLRLLRIEKLATDRAQLVPLVMATGGNPKAIEMAIGCVKYGHQPLQEVIADLYSARGVDNLFDDLFTRCWELLNLEAQHLLLSMPLFPTTVNVTALMTVTAIQGMAFDRAMEYLTDLALIDVRQSDMNSVPRYSLHPLVRAFAAAKLKEQTEFETVARDRLIKWALDLVRKVGFCWDDLSKLESLDPEHETLHSIIEWTLKNHRCTETLELTKGIQYYYNVRGIWDKKLPNNLLRAEAARNLSNLLEEVEALADHVQMLSKQDNVTEAGSYLLRLRKLAQSIQLPGDILFVFQHAIALYWTAQQDLEKAYQAWDTALSHAEQFSKHTRISTQHWIAICLYRQGKLIEAKQLFREVLYNSIEVGYQRSIMFSRLGLADIALDQGNIEEADDALSASSTHAYYYQDRSCIAQIKRSYARLHILRGDFRAAHIDLTEAVDIFERLGMRRQLSEARGELIKLKTIINE
jgi:hypothetical protein